MDTILSGRLVAIGGATGLTNARVEAWNPAGPVRVGAGLVRRGGVFSIVLPESTVAMLKERRQPLELRVVHQGSFVRVEPPVRWQPGDKPDGLALHAALDREGRQVDGGRCVFGRVTVGPRKRPASGVIVRAFDRGLREEQLLGEAKTGRDGRYAIGYRRDAFAHAEKDRADLLLRVYDGRGKTLLHEPRVEELVYNARAEERVDIELRREVPQAESEFERLLALLKPLLAKVDLHDLKETRQTRDITFLARETGTPPARLEHLVLAHRMARQTGAAAEVFYALLRMDTLLPARPVPDRPMRLAIAINDDTHSLLLEAALVDAKAIRRDVAAATKSGIVPAGTGRKVRPVLDALARLRPEAEKAQTEVLPDRLLAIAERLAARPETVKRLVALAGAKGNFSDFLEAATSAFMDEEQGARGHAAAPAARRRSARLAASVGPKRLTLEAVAAANRMSEARLAALSPAQWREAMRKAGVSDREADLQARRLQREAEARQPTAAVLSRLQRGTMTLRATAPTIEILKRHADIDLRSANLDKFFAEHRLTGSRERKVLGDLKKVQRVMKLAPDLERTEKLLAQRIGAASDIVASGRSRFMGVIAPRVGLSRSEARTVFERAQTVHAATLMIAGEIQSATAPAPAAAAAGDLAALTASASVDFPNLASLFGQADHCKCAHCRSVFSPAAYLVELLEFLDKRDMVDLTQSPPVHVNMAKDVFLSRRGEIADLDLNCENAETPLPYIDIVCELLEAEVAPDPGVPHNGALTAGVAPAALLATLRAAGWEIGDTAILQPPDIHGNLILRDAGLTAKLVNQGGNAWRVFRLRQTHGLAADLSAAPEYVNAAAYAILAGANYAFTLPFDLNHAEASAYFERFGLQRTALMRDFATGGAPAPHEIAAEGLGLADAIRALIVAPNPAGQGSIWALPPASVVADMSVVKTMLDKTGLSYEALDRLLQMRFVDPAGTLFIRHLDLSCDLAKKEVAGLDAAALDRIHRFLRLQRATGWADVVLDEALVQPNLGNGTLDNAALVRIEALQRLAGRTGMKPEELTACFGEIRHALLTGSDALPIYHRIFLNKATLGHVEDGLKPEAVGAGGTIAPLAPALAAILKLTAENFERLRSALTDDQLTFANLSRLYAAARLCDRLKLSAADLLTLMARTGIDPFAAPQNMLDLLDELDRARAGPLKIAEMPFMLEHAGELLAVRETTDAKIAELLAGLQAAYQAAFADTRSAFDPDRTADELRAPIKDALLRLPGFSEDAANTVLRMYDADWSSPPEPAAAATLGQLLGGYFDTAGVAAAQAAVAAAAPGAALEAARLAMADTLLAAVARHLHALAKGQALAEALAAFSRQDAELVTTILERAVLGQPGPATPRIADVLSDDALIDTAGDPPVPPAINQAAFPDQFRAVRLLHKLLPLARATGLALDELGWLIDNATAMGWVRLDAIPYEAGQVAVSHAEWDQLARIITLFKAFPPTPNPADPALPVTFAATLQLLLPGSATTRAAWLDAVVRLTGHDRQTLDDLDSHFGWSAVNLDAWRLPQTWEALRRCMGHLRLLGGTVAMVQACVQPVLGAAETASLRVALKARYAESVWLTTLAEITNAIRPKKRDALVAFLLAERPQWTTPTDLFDHFLIDVEMEAKMPSSRIVQAHGALQLFIERSRMGLEPQAAADTADTGWEQWKWMRNYRVWEANRKVFVHPENWIEPELLDDKSTLFRALEEELLQNEVTEQSTEDAFIRYLEGLDGISFLEVVTVYHQADIHTMHVFARTKGGDPAQYYHRRLVKERYWTPWMPVELDITSDSLLAFVRNNRLHLAWPVVSEETNPDQDVTTPGVSESPSSGPMQNPEARLRIQLAVSEYANGLWKPRKISQDAIVSPESFTTDPDALDRKRFNLLYNQFSDQIWLFHTALDNDWEHHTLDGIFDVTGCKGYPEVRSTGKTYLPDFYPDYKDSLLQRQRYFEVGQDQADTLAIRNMITFWGHVVRFDKTPGWFRVTHPHQFTLIDLIYVLIQIWFANAYKTSVAVYERSLKLPLGTWLPYFFEDSARAYVIVPGLYARRGQPQARRTFSDFLQLIQDIIALVAKYVAKLSASPAPDPADVMDELAADPAFLHIRDEIALYRELDFGEQVKNLYHPLICPLRATLYKHGVGEMMKRGNQLQQTDFKFETTFAPNTAVIVESYPVEDVDFTSDGSYSLYNWELFFHAPLMIAKRLASEQRFEEAMVWYHRIFNPTGTLEGAPPQKYWVTKPFYQTTDAQYVAQRIDNLLTNVADPASPERADLEFAIEEWRTRPFRPHVVARFRTVAYQRAVVMGYIGTLIDWGDYLFRQDTMESITQATQMYVLAEKLLGERPRTVASPVETGAQTYAQLVADLDAFGNALVELENYLPDLGVLPEEGAELPPPPVTLSSLYFCVPPNEKMLSYWDTVEDRLFKIRNSQNIDGVERVLTLFAPPIDPGMLVRAAAAGLDLSAILAGMNAPLPAYRFHVLARKATELAEEVRQLGNALLGALEKKDAEALALLRNDLEVKLLKAQRDLKRMEIDAAQEQIEAIRRSREVTKERHDFYSAFERINAKEQLNLDKLGEAQAYQVGAGVVRATGAVLGIIPDFSFGGHGAGGSPAIHATFGGSTLATVAEAAATVLNILSGIASYEATRAATLGGFDRRADDAGLQARTSALEMGQIDQQIVVAELRRDIAEKDLAVHDVQIENAEKISKTLSERYTNAELYQWMINETTSVYYRAYQLAYDTAKKAERCFQHELGTSETFLAFGYWDSRKKGLQTANKLLHDIRRMEGRYLEINRREYEVTKHVSLRQLDPLALARFKSTGVCDFEIPEALYDMDHPGHYFRRIRTVAVSIPCVAGPYSSVSARLTQVANRYRASTARAAGAGTPKEEYEEAVGNDARFVYNVGTSQSVATSSGQNDAGLFQLDFRDDRYLPFEGTGAISAWRLELPDVIRQFDYSTISDVIIHVRYTAREGGSTLRQLASTTLKEKLQEMRQGLGKTGLHVVVDLKRDHFNAWHELKSTGATNLTISGDRLPYFTQPLGPVLGTVTLLAGVAGKPASFTVGLDGSNVNLNLSSEWGLNLADHAGLALDTPVALTVPPAQVSSLEELSFVLKVDFP
ncbi:Tc toxin subunit A-related protein [Chelativorans intermedius]|uniref:Neuraminidase-like domain-containing protein n=1 Tax=Chelativorans intermedius TaxID=515947 RepID=A0ABV6D2U9_9HYPH|nr:neuraminidase-like domain-containing protein [Chelativorans intermedius]MCT8997229.1 neuraminidase-like domain-containing protein [Chelativorans intermedius]